MPPNRRRLPYRVTAFAESRLPELTDLWIAAWKAAMPTIDFEARRTWFIDHLTAIRQRDVDIVCALDAANGAIAGFFTLDRDSGHIDQLAVEPRYWTRGAAGALIAEAKRRAPGLLKLEVNQDNPRAVRFYEKNGFRRHAAGVNPTSGLRTWRYEWVPPPRL